MNFVFNKCGLQPELPDIEHAEPSFEPEVATSDVADGEIIPPARSSMRSSRRFSETSLSSKRTTESSKTSSGLIGNRLLLARRQARFRDLRLRGPTVGSAMALGVMALLVRIKARESSLMFVLSSWSIDLCAYISSLSLLPTDKLFVHIFGAFFSIPVLLCYIYSRASEARAHSRSFNSNNCMVDGDSSPCWLVHFLFATHSIDLIAMLQAICRIGYALVLRLPSKVTLSTTLSSFGIAFFIWGIAATLRGIAAAIAGIFPGSGFYFAAAFGHIITGCAFSFTSALDFRKRIQSWFMSRGQTAILAAAISQLLGGESIDKILDLARNTFLFIRANNIYREHMAENCPDPTLSRLTEQGGLGLVDAFVSHSWHDCAAAKWVALQELRDEFKAEHSREPTLWIDKYCINQDKIDDSLACLPVFLSGCGQLWILCGKTYLERLWCVMEIVFFLEMGGNESQLVVKLLGEATESANLDGDAVRTVDTLKSDATLIACLKAFDAQTARCSTKHDTEKLQAVLDAIGREQITEIIRNVFEP